VFAQEEYVLGEGYQVGELPIYLGGYFSADYQKKDEIDRYRLDDIAFMSYGGNNTVSYLVELEFKEFYVETHDNNGKTTERDHRLYIERLYVDYTINDNFVLRGGRYNSPVGFWNLMPINVLRATTSSPVSNVVIFPNYTTGLNLSYSSFEEDAIRLDVILQDNTPIDDEYNNYDIDKHYALGLSYEKNDLILKINGGYFSKRDRHQGVDDFSYMLLSGKYETDDYQILSEVGAQSSKEKDHNYAGYVQGLYRFTPKHIGIIRLESYKDELESENDNMAIFAYTFRPMPSVALKSEYQQHTQSNENQFIFSFSVLF
jgi:hypothetical protein